jgi:hypothetical protein
METLILVDLRQEARAAENPPTMKPSEAETVVGSVQPESPALGCWCGFCHQGRHQPTPRSRAASAEQKALKKIGQMR